MIGPLLIAFGVFCTVLAIVVAWSSLLLGGKDDDAWHDLFDDDEDWT